MAGVPTRRAASRCPHRPSNCCGRCNGCQTRRLRQHKLAATQRNPRCAHTEPFGTAPRSAYKTNPRPTLNGPGAARPGRAGVEPALRLASKLVVPPADSRIATMGSNRNSRTMLSLATPRGSQHTHGCRAHHRLIGAPAGADGHRPKNRLTPSGAASCRSATKPIIQQEHRMSELLKAVLVAAALAAVQALAETLTKKD